MKSPILVCLLATTAMAVTPALAANTMSANPAPAVQKTAVAPALDTNIAMLQVKQSKAFGKYLTDGSGRPLYMFSADTPAKDDVLAKSACTGACAVAWPPATIKNTPKSGSGIDTSDISTIARADGTKQLTYDGRPLYLFIHDQGASAPMGQAKKTFGGEWHLVTPSGAMDQKGIG
jgi:predicted lipoprotein with Yx(FWY)xxD motif